MTTGPLSRRLEAHRPRVAILLRLVAIARAPALDGELAAGMNPSVSAAHRLRADHLRRRPVRRRIATALERAVEDACHPDLPGTPQVPLRREAIHRCRREIQALAKAVATADQPRTQGVAIAFQLAFDGGSPLFLQAQSHDGVERLANTVQAALSALRVSAEFDGTGH